MRDENDVSACWDENSEFSLVPDPALVAEGWVLRNLADPRQAKDSTELYLALGYEVIQRPVGPKNFGPACGSCAQEACKTFVLVYTRKGGSKE